MEEDLRDFTRRCRNRAHDLLQKYGLDRNVVLFSTIDTGSRISVELVKLKSEQSSGLSWATSQVIAVRDIGLLRIYTLDEFDAAFTDALKKMLPDCAAAMPTLALRMAALAYGEAPALAGSL